MHKILTIVAGTAVAVAGSIALTGTASAATYLGGVNVQSYCSQFNSNGFTYTAEVVAPGDAYSWRCYTPAGNGGWLGVNMNLACEQQHGNPSAYGRPANAGNPYSWGCYV